MTTPKKRSPTNTAAAAQSKPTAPVWTTRRMGKLPHLYDIPASYDDLASILRYAFGLFPKRRPNAS